MQYLKADGAIGYKSTSFYLRFNCCTPNFILCESRESKANLPEIRNAEMHLVYSVIFMMCWCIHGLRHWPWQYFLNIQYNDTTLSVEGSELAPFIKIIEYGYTCIYKDDFDAVLRRRLNKCLLLYCTVSKHASIRSSW